MRRLVTALAVLLMAASGNQAHAAANAADQEKTQAAPAPAQAKRPQHSQVNVRLTLAITDETGAGEPVRKTITLLLADGGSGRVRSSAMAHKRVMDTDPRAAFVVTLNADAFIGAIDGNRVQADITVEYSPGTSGDAASGAPAEQRGSPLNQSVSVWLTSGTPTVIVEASDPMSDRKVTLEATATIQR